MADGNGCHHADYLLLMKVSGGTVCERPVLTPTQCVWMFEGSDVPCKYKPCGVLTHSGCHDHGARAVMYTGISQVVCSSGMQSGFL